MKTEQQTGMLPVALPTERCKSCSSVAETDALQKDLHNKTGKLPVALPTKYCKSCGSVAEAGALPKDLLTNRHAAGALQIDLHNKKRVILRNHPSFVSE